MLAMRTNGQSIGRAAETTPPAIAPDFRLRRRRRVLLLVATLLVSIEVGGTLVASAAMARTAAPAQDQPPVPRFMEVGGVNSGQPASPWMRLAAELPIPESSHRRTQSVLTADDRFDQPPRPAPAPTPTPEPTPLRTPASAGVATAATGGSAGASRTTAVVTHRFRFPDLRIERTTRSYPCDRAEPPGDYIYRWGCAGRNNLYLLGHAHSVFKALHDAYAAGRLRVGMKAWYTDGSGRTRLYRVTTWRLVRPTDVAWAIASQPVPSMTLQTCYGPNNEYRLLVRLVSS
jgi:hypothetical protein